MWPGTLFDSLGAWLSDFDFVFVYFSPWGSHQHLVLPCVSPRRDSARDEGDGAHAEREQCPIGLRGLHGARRSWKVELGSLRQ